MLMLKDTRGAKHPPPEGVRMHPFPRVANTALRSFGMEEYVDR